MTFSLRDRMEKIAPWVRMFNFYSVSECHDVTCAGKYQIYFFIFLSLIFKHFIIDVSKASDLEQSKFAPVGAPLPGVNILIMDNEYNVKSIGISGEVKLYLIWLNNVFD